jgi:hypothetical protein
MLLRFGPNAATTPAALCFQLPGISWHKTFSALHPAKISEPEFMASTSHVSSAPFLFPFLQPKQQEPQK